MPIVYQKMIHREDLRANPDKFYVFGDNAVRIGMGGQAGEMRGEPNAIGVATKRAPSMSPGSFFSDCEEDARTLAADMLIVNSALMTAKIVVVPRDGLGTGLSQLPTRAPRLYAGLYAFFHLHSDNIGCPWVKPKWPWWGLRHPRFS